MSVDSNEMAGLESVLCQTVILNPELVGVLCRMFCNIDCCCINSLTEETVEEGEIVRESPLESVVEGCGRIMSNFLSQLHSSTCHTHLTPQGQSSGASGAVGPELDLVVSLQGGVLEWAGRFLDLFEQDTDNHIW